MRVAGRGIACAPARDAAIGDERGATPTEFLTMFTHTSRIRCWKMIERQYPETRTKYQTFDELLGPRLKRKDVLLDLGCGDNTYSREYGAAAGLAIIGIDPDLEALKRTPGLHLKIVADAEQLPIADAAVNHVTARFVVEHLRDPDKAFSEVSRILTPGGDFVVMTPNLFNFYTLVAWIVPNRFHTALLRKIAGSADLETFATYYRANTVAQLSQKLRRHGLEPDTVVMYQPPPYGLVFSGVLCQLAIWYCKLIRRADWLRFLRGVIIAAYRKPSGVIERRADGAV